MSGAWVNGATYRATYRVTDFNTLALNTAVQVGGARDAAGNLMAVTTFQNPFTVEMQNPRVTAITRLVPARVGSGRVTFRVTFSEPVSGLTLADFRAATTGTLTGARMVRVSAEIDRSFRVTVRTGTGSDLR